ncbi:hypothetical protein CIPAW_07G009900 [Carya illinoinensis]|uniref:Uncharacterized protein n=1 Tax=Carya illinoinensis TaxID=32201 RepID=A0A8T1PQI3_CARIL|nr:hypothetical protein CIPAW_07G009900 [Carya illinoinensis]
MEASSKSISLKIQQCVLASLQPSESNRPAENYQRRVHQRSTPILWESTQQTPSLYHMQCQNWAYFPEWPCTKSGSKNNCYSSKTACWHLQFQQLLHQFLRFIH